MRKRMSGAVVTLLLLLSFAWCGRANAMESYQRDLLWGAAAAATNVFYSPAKLVYAGIGGLVGGLAYVWTAGNLAAAHQVWSPTMGGTYVITPAMLRGEKSILFIGGTYGF